jgi:DNA replication protein DnaC
MFAGREAPPTVTKWVCGVLDGSEQRGLVMHGEVGTGKTGLAVAALRALARGGFGRRFQWNVLCAAPPLAEDEIEEDELDGQPVTTPEPSPCWFASCSTLNAQLRRRRQSEKDWFAKLRDNVGALALDDVGMDRATEFTENMLYDHLVWREERAGRILILTTNVPKGKNWFTVFGRCADRLADVSQFVNVHMAGDSLRPKRAGTR